jgi:type IV fimbrial biogenesis protein FimT
MAALNYARSEAIRRGVSVTVRKSGSQWENGYFAFVDCDGDGTQDKDSCEETLRTWPALPEGYTLRPNNNNFNNYLRYNPQGAVDNNSVGGTFALCYQEKKEGAKAIVIKPLRPRLGIDSDGDRIPEKDTESGYRNIESCLSP